MTKSRIVALLALSVCAVYTQPSAAQDMSFDLEETEKPAESTGEKTEGDTKATGETGGEVGAQGDIIGDLAKDEPATAAKAESAGPKPTEMTEEIYAVQQIYALRNNRVELMPSFGFTLNDPFVSHPNFGLGVNYWITNVLAIGANINWYQGLESRSDLNFHVQRSTRLATRPTEFQFGASFNFTYVPLYGKFAMFNRYIFQWDAYVVGGIGLMRTRPVPVVDPEYRSFDYTYKLSIVNPGLGLRIFLTKWLTAFAEMRAYPYLEKLENLRVGLDQERTQKSTWLDDSPTLVFNVVASIGMTIYFPFRVEYKKPK